MFPEDIQTQAQQIVAIATARGLTIAAAESCTGGLIAAALTAVPGSSSVLDRGFVTYSNRAKVEMLGVSEAILSAHGAVSEQIAVAMAQGAVTAARVDIAVSVTGIAGPGGGSPQKPVGLVHFAATGPAGLVHREERFGDIGRDAVRLASLRVALFLLAEQFS